MSKFCEHGTDLYCLCCRIADLEAERDKAKAEASAARSAVATEDTALKVRITELEAERDELRAALGQLVIQVDRSNAVDDHGHQLSNNRALVDARNALAKGGQP